MAKIKIKDGSGDRHCFTIVPNYILNHSTANDQSLYLHLKRYAGDDGKCFATQETIMKKMGIGRTAYNKSLKYLIDHSWIDYIGMTGGKTRPIKTYKVNNIWELNNNHYKKIPAETAVSTENEKDTVQNSSKIPAETAIEEDLVLLRSTNTSKAVALRGDQWSELIDPFEKITPFYKEFYKNTTERKALDSLASELGFNRLREIIVRLPAIIAQPYAPKVTKPSELKRDYGKLKAFYDQNKNKINKYQITKIH